MRTSYWLKWSCPTLFHCRYLYTVYMKNSLRFEISLQSISPKWNLHRSEFHLAWTHMNANNEVTLHWMKFYPSVKSKIGLSSLRSHVNLLLVITVFRNFYRISYNIRFETTSSSALILHYNEKISEEWASFWKNFRKKEMLLLNHSYLCFLYLEHFRIVWIYALNEYKNEYIIFCKEHNFKRLPLL